SGPCTVTINGKAYGIELKGDKAVVNGKEIAFTVADGIQKAAPAAAPTGNETEVKASVPGSILRITASVGATVAKGDELLVMDVMKMETPVTAPCDGTVKAIQVAQTDKVNTGDVLVLIG
ncbi:MAG: biotin attachment protein, partial [Kiritimatiellae bacterium]|nr:biotin attachment protein [Kiritimatiellia bacterium]